MPEIKYKRILLKLSGEALAGDQHRGLDFSVIGNVCQVIRQLCDLGVEVGLVIGGGNFWRGVKDGADKMQRSHGDAMGMLATVMNSIAMADARGMIDAAEYGRLLTELRAIPEKIERVIEDKERIQWFAAKFSNAREAFFIGRGIDYAISLEGSLKMKEISYVHSEAYAAGELKHGTISLIENGTLVIGILTQEELYEKMISNMAECKSRGAYLMGITNYGNYNTEDTADFTVYIPKTDPHFTASLAVIPLQLLGYYLSITKGLDVDKPRNLAKSVTVE